MLRGRRPRIPSQRTENRGQRTVEVAPQALGFFCSLFSDLCSLESGLVAQLVRARA